MDQAVRQPGKRRRTREDKNQRVAKIGRGEPRGHTTDTGGASSQLERRSQDSGKMHKSHTSGKAQGKFLNFYVRRPLGATKNLNGKKARPGKDVKKSEALDTLAILYARFEKVSKSLGDVDQKFEKRGFAEVEGALDNAKEAQRFAEIAAQQVHDSRGDYRRHSEDHEAAKDDLGCIRALVGDTAAAKSALSCGMIDRDSNELKYLQDALRLVDSLLCREIRDDFEMSVTAVKTEGQVKMKRVSPCERRFLFQLTSRGVEWAGGQRIVG